jgi:hypothetical protein
VRALTDWVDRLADVLLDDRIDQGWTEASARAAAERYRRWHEALSVPHDPSTCALERDIHRWPGDLGFHTGRSSVFVARQGAGKTNAIAFLIQHALVHRPDWDIYTNVPFPWDYFPGAGIPGPPHLHPVRSMSAMLRGMANSELAGRIPAVATDEMDQAISSHTWREDADESWTKFLYIERHLRVRGPLMAFHVYEHVPLSLRRVGDLRGSYFRVVVLGGERLLARVEDQTQWWAVGESDLPFLSTGLRGFSIDVNMGDLENHVDGDRKTVARQILSYLDELDTKRRESGELGPDEARGRHSASVEEVHRAAAEDHGAKLARREEVIAAILREPNLTARELQARFHVSSRKAVELRKVAELRAGKEVLA